MKGRCRDKLYTTGGENRRLTEGLLSTPSFGTTFKNASASHSVLAEVYKMVSRLVFGALRPHTAICNTFLSTVPERSHFPSAFVGTLKPPEIISDFLCFVSLGKSV